MRPLLRLDLVCSRDDPKLPELIIVECRARALVRLVRIHKVPDGRERQDAECDNPGPVEGLRGVGHRGGHGEDGAFEERPYDCGVVDEFAKETKAEVEWSRLVLHVWVVVEELEADDWDEVGQVHA